MKLGDIKRFGGDVVLGGVGELGLVDFCSSVALSDNCFDGECSPSTVLTGDKDMSAEQLSREFLIFCLLHTVELDTVLTPGLNGNKLGKSAEDSSGLTTSKAFFSEDVAAMRPANEPGKSIFELNFFVLLQYWLFDNGRVGGEGGLGGGESDKFADVEEDPML